MNQNDLLSLLRDGENSGVEFKRDDVEPRALAKEIVALANLRGGRVLLGVEDDATISGIQRPDLEERVRTVCRDKISPEIIPYFETIRDVQGRDVAVISVEAGWTVHHVWHNSGRTYYIRVGSQSREASQEELARLLQQRGLFSVETRPVAGAGFGELDFRRVKDYFVRIRQQTVPVDADAPAWETLLENTEFLARGEAGMFCTVAGLLLFGKRPNRFLPQAGIDAVSYAGTEPDYSARARLAMRGPLVPLLSDAGVVENGLVETAIHFVKAQIPDGEELENGIRRVPKEGFPTEVQREALVNALVHRDYLLSATDIQLSIFADRLEIRSPGRLPNGITPVRMLTGCRAARNQLLKDVMRDYGYLEHMGMGIPRKIVAGMKAFNGTEPRLIEEGESFTVTLLR